MSVIRLVGRAVLLLLAFLIPVVTVGALGAVISVNTSMPRPSGEEPTQLTVPALRPYDAAKPTVAVVLGAQVHEVTDVFGPYAMFVESGLYNVYMVASDRTPRAIGTRTLYTLSNAINLVPDYSFKELDAMLGRSPDIIVVPQMIGAQAPENEPLLAYIRRHADQGATLFSWCTGTNVLAAAGVLDGKPATTHWGDIDRLEKAYPKVQWRRGVRYVDAGQVLTTGGVTSGIDGTLYFLAQRHGQEVADRVAAALNYEPTIELDESPQVEQFKIGAEDLIYLLNASFNWTKRDTGVLVYDGIGDMELAAVLDAEPASLTARTYTVAGTRRVVTSHYGLHLLPHWSMAELPQVDRISVPGAPVTHRTDAAVTGLRGEITAPLAMIHNHAVARAAFEAPLEDLALAENIPTAAFAAKRLEYRANSTQLAGSGWPILLTLQPFLIGAIGVGFVGWMLRHRARRSEKPRPYQRASMAPAAASEGGSTDTQHEGRGQHFA